jgi:drug/metabolite transporter (DMT)-like permease
VFVGFFFQLLGQKNVSTSLSAILLSMESVYGAIFSAIFLGEKMTLRMAIGSALIVSAAIINSYTRKVSDNETKFDTRS